MVDPELEMQDQIGIVATVMLILFIPLLCAYCAAKSFLRDLKRIFFRPRSTQNLNIKEPSK